MTYVDTCINYINETSLIFDNSFEVLPRNLIWPKSEWVIAFINGALEFFTRER